MRRITASTVCCFWLTCSLALAEGNAPESPKTPPGVGDEIIVLGKSIRVVLSEPDIVRFSAAPPRPLWPR